MKKNSTIVGIIIVLIILVAGGFALFHKGNKNPGSSSSSSSTGTTAPVNNAVLATKASSSLGQYLTEPNGQPLYTYNADSNGVSNCSGACLSMWPAYQDKGTTTGLPAGVGTIKRTDNGQVQYTYNGMPLYTFVDDHNDQPTGNGVQNFSIAKPAAASSSSSTSPSTNTNTAPAPPSSNYNY